VSERIVDAWIQHPTRGFIGHEMFASLRRWMGIDEVPAAVPVDLTLGALDAADVAHALVSAWHGPDGALIPNDDVARLCHAHPDRFTGIASVDIRRPMEGVRELRRAVGELGLRGLRFLPWLWGVPPDDRRCYPLYAACVELGIPFCTQVGHAGPLRESEPGRPIPYLDRVALEFPELTIVGGHVGYPWTDEMIALAAKYPNVHIDTSAYKPKRYPNALVEYMRGPGRRKVLFGSNYPMLMPGDCLAGVDALGLDGEARRLFLSGNADRVFGLDDRAGGALTGTP
jgi:predicted TIM-barrel fold metal-dependent hydrolase